MYVVAQTRPTLEFKFEKSRPIEECNGFVALPLEQMLDIKRAYEARRVGEKPVAKTFTSAYDEEIEREIEWLGGINLEQNQPLTELE
jgi:hypothetical protein